MVGIPGIPKNVDWTSIFIHELDVRAAYIYNHAEMVNGKRWKTFDLAIDLLAKGKVDLSWIITHKFHLEDYRMVFRLLNKRGDSGVIKAVFEFNRPSATE